MNRKKYLFPLLVLLAVLSLSAGLVGCTPEGSEKNVLRVGLSGEVEGINPLLIWSVPAYEIMKLNYNMLITWDENIEPIGSLAREWKMDDDGLHWTFYLEEGVKWQDGEPFTAGDVKFTFEYVRDNQLGYFYDSVKDMKEIEIVDEYTIGITLDEPVAWMPQIYCPILPQHIWGEIDPAEASSDFQNLEPVGTGAFQVVEHVTGEYTRLIANKDYFKGAPEIDEIIFRNYSNADLMVEALKQDELDIITAVPGAQFKALEEENPENICTLPAMSPGFSQLAVNVWQDPASQGNPLLKDRRIRQALELAIDRERIIEMALFGYGEPGSTLVTPTYSYWQLVLDDDELRSFDLEKAKGLLDEAGYAAGSDGIRLSPEGEKLSFGVMVRSSAPDDQKTAKLMKEWFREIGVDLEVQVMDEGTLNDRIYESDWDLYIWGWYVEYDPASILKIMTTGEIMSWNDSFYSNPDYDELYLKQQQALDREERQEIIYEMQRMVYEDAPYIVLYIRPSLQAYRTDRFTGWVQTPAGNGPVVHTLTVASYEQLKVKDK